MFFTRLTKLPGPHVLESGPGMSQVYFTISTIPPLPPPQLTFKEPKDGGQGYFVDSKDIKEY